MNNTHADDEIFLKYLSLRMSWNINDASKHSQLPYFANTKHVMTMYINQIYCNDPRAAGTPDRVVTDLILVMETSEECRREWVQQIPRVPQSREHKSLQL